MERPRKKLVWLLFIATAVLSLADGAWAQARPEPGMLRDEIAQVAQRLPWRGPALPDDTLAAAALSGLSWKPSWHGAPLLVETKKHVEFAPPAGRSAAFREAQSEGSTKIAAAYAFSLALDPGEGGDWRTPFEYLAPLGQDLDDALSGVMQAPEKLSMLPDYRHAAADLLVLRASPRLLPLLLTLASSADPYLRSRAVAGIGAAAYRAGGVASRPAGFAAQPREASISATQRRMIDDVVQRAAEDSSFRVRAAAALALGLAGDEADIPLLEKLAKDRAYLSSHGARKGEERIEFPVRMQAAASLARFGRTAEPGGGVLSGKPLQQAKRGAHDVTREATDPRGERPSRISFNDLAW